MKVAGARRAMEFLIATESIGACEVWKEESVVESLYGFPAVISVRTGPFEQAPGFLSPLLAFRLFLRSFPLSLLRHVFRC